MEIHQRKLKEKKVSKLYLFFNEINFCVQWFSDKCNFRFSFLQVVKSNHEI